MNYDDHAYVTDNIHVTGGLSWSNLGWAWGTGYAANWHPLTWLSHMLDCQIFGLQPGPMHLVNVALHAANTGLLFFALWRLTGRTKRSALVAGLFALHPVHVESVAWIAERKDLLSTCFWMLALLAYERYVRLATFGRYSLVTTVFAFGLLSKPMVVTLPCVLLLLDYWPLQRLRTRADLGRLSIEKFPLLLLSALACTITYLVQQTGGAVVKLESVSLLPRLGNALESYFFYLGKTLWPSELFVPYWYDFKVEFLPLAGAAVCFAGLAWGCLVLGQRCGYLPVGWFWYLGTLVPVIGIVQVGSQSAADRYTYLPSIGIFMALVWAGADLAVRWRLPMGLRVVFAGSILATSMLLTSRQLGYWKNSVTLFQHTLECDPPNLIAMDLLAWTYATDLDPFLRDGPKALELALFTVQVTERRDGYSLKTLAAAYAQVQQFGLAIQTIEEALRLPETPLQPQLFNDLHKNLELYRNARTLHSR